MRLGRAGLLGPADGQRAGRQSRAGDRAPPLAAVLWGLFAAPRASVSIPLASGGVQLLVFGSAAAALYVTGRHALALTFAVLVVANVVLVSL